ncbi:LacI family DNA-binding transcriptional regulator [Nonomuraea sp. NN258]|uniref:LacI family DNA-binding transcriptional regulator n=1 Tax=Nonomuraea antri TaxID=2730852 RepID=UPI00156A6ED3|nr:LacI family DNA-binding transcriptional regulator [Nonomuraea antri]NRQ30280.1 LacI family DNA-binding transcriptional regulator [Nonomuraea antri]
MRPRLKDVAERAGVSIKTVSNVVNDYPHVSPETRARVEAAISELSYRPNLSARSLRAGRSGVVALAVPHLDNPYFAELATHVISAADQRGWTVLIDQTRGDRDKERLVVAGIRAHLIDGLLFSPLALTSRDLADRADRTPMVLLGERIGTGRSPYDHVGIDNVAAARAATLHLAGLGRTRIAALGAQRALSGATARLRLKGYKQALAQCGLREDPSLISYVPVWHRSGGAAAMAELLESRPDAVFCFNDALALGALRTLLSRGFRVPDDVMLMGFDDIEDGRFVTPTLSTVAPDKALIAESAVDLLAARLDGADVKPCEVRVPHHLTPRESTCS